MAKDKRLYEYRRFLKRYFRQSKEHLDGAIQHMEGCAFPQKGVCTCGLLHDLGTMYPSVVMKWYENYEEERATQELVLGTLSK